MGSSVAAAATIAVPGWAQVPDVAPVVRVPSDVGIIEAALALHPGLDRYWPVAEREQALTQLSRQWPSLPKPQQYLALARFLARIRCGHSYPNFFNQTAAVNQQLFDTVPRVPFAFRWINDAMVVTGNAGGTERLLPGTIITGLNSQTSGHILRTLMPLIRADGGNDGKRRALLEMQGDAGLETFDIFHGLVFGGTDRDAIRIEARLPNGRTICRELASATRDSREAGMPTRRAPRDGPVWQWTERTDGIALLTMPTWGLHWTSWDWRAWLDERLTTLPRNGRLVVDLRNNEGGFPCGDAILARLTDRDLNSIPFEWRVRFRTTSNALNPFLDTWDESFRSLGENAEDIGGGFYRLPAEQVTGMISARSPQIHARVAVLTSAVNSSATHQFADRCRSTGLARLFGSTTGGNRRGLNAGKFFFVRLPFSGLEFDLPLVGSFPTTPQPDAGIVPDVVVAPTAADIAAGRDPVLDAAVDWLVRS
jgi:Peptidase family S41